MKRNYINTLLSFIIVILFNIFLTADTIAVSPTITPKLSPSPTAEPSVAEEDIRNSLIERLKKAAEQKSDEVGSILGAGTKVSVMGTLSDIATGTLTINTSDDSEGMVATNEQTAFVRNNKPVKPEEMRIGEFIIAMGYKNDRDILEARRVVVGNDPPVIPDRLVILGVIGEIDSKNRTFELMDNENKYEVTVAKKVSLDFNKLKDGGRMIIIAEKMKDDEKLLSLKVYKDVNF